MGAGAPPSLFSPLTTSRSGDFVSLCNGLSDSVSQMMSVGTDSVSSLALRELPSRMVLDTRMRTSVIAAAACAALVGVALAQVEASSSTYFLDVDPARYSGPAGQRLAVIIDDQPRHVAISDQDEICVQLQRSAPDSNVINAHVRVLRPEPHDAVVVRLVAPDISPGTYRSTPWGLLLRVVPSNNAVARVTKPVGTGNAPVCKL
jgi:hypothetical protein